MIRNGKFANPLRKVYLSNKFMSMMDGGGKEGEKNMVRTPRVKQIVWDSAEISRMVPDSCLWGLI